MQSPGAEDSRCGYTVVRELCRKEGKQILQVNTPKGPAVRRVYPQGAPAYERLLGVDCSALPRVYAVEQTEAGTVVTEEFIDGLLLSEVLETARPDEAQAAAIMRRLCAALEVLHGLGLVHRDVKAENVMLTAQGRVALLDLDAAAELKPEKETDTRLLGTAGYAAPEQFGISRADVRSDIYALGVLLNIMLTGEHPSVKLASGRLGGVVKRCIQVNVDLRYPSVKALVAQLPRPGKEETCPTCGFVTPGGGCLYCGRANKRRRPPLWLLALGAVAVVLCTVLLLWRPGQPVPPAEASATEYAQLYMENGDVEMRVPISGSCSLRPWIDDGQGGRIALGADDKLWLSQPNGQLLWYDQESCFDISALETTLPGDTTLILAEKDGVTYGLPVTFLMPWIGLYDRPVDRAAPAEGFLCKLEYGAQQVELTYSAGREQTVYVAAGDTFPGPITDLTVTGPVSARLRTEDGDRSLALTLDPGQSGTVTGTLSFFQCGAWWSLTLCWREI